MEILSKNFNSQKVTKGMERCGEVYNSNKIGTISNKSYIKVNALGKTWRVKEEAESKWLRISKIEDWIRNNLNEVLGALSIGITGILIYFLMFMYS